MCVARGNMLELLSHDEQGKVLTLAREEVFGNIRKIIQFRLTGYTKDFVVVGSDSGRIVFLEFEESIGKFRKVHQETYGKTGCRRTIPGQFLAADPKGRTVMIAAVEKEKFVYILNRDTENKLTISSPLEAHKSHTLVFDLVGVDVGYENPLFACLEVDFGECEVESSAVCTGEYNKLLTFYEMDLGLNHVVRKYAEEVPESAHMLVPIPGGQEGPGGVFVCCEGHLLYKKVEHEELGCPFPKRYDVPSKRSVFIISYAVHKGRKDGSFYLLQSDLGDLYKVTLNVTGEEVHGILIEYFDTLPPATTMGIMRKGYLFIGSEFGNHQFYKFESIREEGATQTYSSMKRTEIVGFNQRKPINLSLCCELQSLAIPTQMKVADLVDEKSPQIYLLTGRCQHSALRVLRHGTPITQIAASPMPGQPTGIWTLKESPQSKYHKFMIVSFAAHTMVLSIGEKVVQVPNSVFETTKQTLEVGLLEDGSVIQVLQQGIIHVKSEGRRVQWTTNGNIVKSASNSRQLVLALAGGQIIYFELNSLGMLLEVEKKVIGTEVCCLDVGPIPEGRQRSKFLAVGDVDKTVKIFSLDPETCLGRISMQALPALPSGVCLIRMQSAGRDAMGSGDSDFELFLHVGLSNGVLLRTVVDAVTGVLTDSRTRFLGVSPVRLFKIDLNNTPALCALSNTPWVCYNYLHKYLATPLYYEPLHYVSNFCSEICPEGLVGLVDNSLRIIAIDKLGELFNQRQVPLSYTPREMDIDPRTGNIYIVESDHQLFPQAERAEIKEKIVEATKDEEYKDLDPLWGGYPRGEAGSWASCLRVVDPNTLATLLHWELEDNEAAFSCLVCQFTNFPLKYFLLIGSAVNLKLQPRSCSTGFITTYEIISGTELALLHRTPVEDLPLCLASYDGRLVAGVGSTLRLYEMGKKRLLKKCQTRSFNSAVNHIEIMGHRIFASELSDSVHGISILYILYI